MPLLLVNSSSFFKANIMHASCRLKKDMERKTKIMMMMRDEQEVDEEDEEEDEEEEDDEDEDA